MVEDSQYEVGEDPSNLIALSRDDNDWFTVLRGAGAVTSTSGGTAPLFNISYGKYLKIKPKKKKKLEGTIFEDLEKDGKHEEGCGCGC
tara:strand:+ start:2861 stop:3124 length:264 start_codon:yes stop_codon:yes gene_type:complete